VDIDVLGSGSSGNCYRISDGQTPLLIECGLPFREIREALDFKLSEIAGCLVSHEHMDHAKAARDLMKAGVDVYASAGTVVALGWQGHRVCPVRTGHGPFALGTWRVIPFPAEHDAAEPLGFLLDSTATGERLLYSGDTCFIRPRFAGLTHIMCEANNSWAAVRGGSAPESVKHRVLKTHMSLATVKDFLLANDLTRVQEIILLHLSDQHSDAEAFRREVQELTGKVVRVA
jgi:phosphoribosyl 1,2-cyclic phosphodiesterase